MNWQLKIKKLKSFSFKHEKQRILPNTEIVPFWSKLVLIFSLYVYIYIHWYTLFLWPNCYKLPQKQKQQQNESKSHNKFHLLIHTALNWQLLHVQSCCRISHDQFTAKKHRIGHSVNVVVHADISAVLIVSHMMNKHCCPCICWNMNIMIMIMIHGRQWVNFFNNCIHFSFYLLRKLLPCSKSKV